MSLLLILVGALALVWAVLYKERLMFLTKTWAKVPIVIGLVSGLITIGSFFMRSNLTIEVLQSYDVLDIRQDVSDLRVFFGEVDLRENDMALRVVRLSFHNRGFFTIREGDYSSTDPLGVEVIAGKIVSTIIPPAGTTYLNRSVRPELKENILILPPIILDAGEDFQVELLLLHNNSEKPTLVPTGKIAGVKSIKLIDNTEQKSNRWADFVALAFIVALMVIALVTVIIQIIKMRIRRQAGATAKILYGSNPASDYIIAEYVQHGTKALLHIKALLSSQGYVAAAPIWALERHAGKDPSSSDGIVELIRLTEALMAANIITPDGQLAHEELLTTLEMINWLLSR